MTLCYCCPYKYNLGVAYAHGHSVQKDDRQAAAWYRKVAEQGFGPAEYRLGLAYAQALGVPQDVGQAETWMREAAEKGLPPAQEWLRKHSGG